MVPYIPLKIKNKIYNMFFSSENSEKSVNAYCCQVLGFHFVYSYKHIHFFLYKTCNIPLFAEKGVFKTTKVPIFFPVLKSIFLLILK